MVVLAAMGCDSNRATDAGAGNDSSVISDAGTGSDAEAVDGGGPDAGPQDGGPSTPDAGAVCTPSTGTAAVAASCQQVAISVLRHSGEPSTVEMHAFLSVEDDDACVIVDTVELHQGEQLVQTLEGVPSGTARRLITARASLADPRLAGRCDSDEGRVDPYRVLIRGRIDGGTFEAECGRRGSGTSWPPDSMVLCQEGLEHGPVLQNRVSVETFMDMPTSSFDIRYLTGGDSTTIDSVSGSVELIPFPDPIFGSGAPLEPTSTDGWTALINTGSGLTPTIDLSFRRPGDALGAELCPDPDGFDAPQPIVMARVRGTGSGGAFVSEANLGTCYPTSLGP